MYVLLAASVVGNTQEQLKGWWDGERGSGTQVLLDVV